MEKKTGVIWVIDGAYVLKGSNTYIDYIKLRREMQEWSIPKGRFDRIVFFNSSNGDEPQKRFHESLESKGFEVILYDIKNMNVKCNKCGERFNRQVQKGVDIGICTTILTANYKRLVLTAGDGDFIDAVRYVQGQFKEVYVSGYANSMCKEFREEADQIKFIE
jgi:uncharacterized LabA/DUF88 family protein